MKILTKIKSLIVRLRQSLSIFQKTVVILLVLNFIISINAFNRAIDADDYADEAYVLAEEALEKSDGALEILGQ